jgi:hypothetical protein
MSPRERVNRAIEGRAAYQHGRFDGIVAALGRTIDSPSRSTG